MGVKVPTGERCIAHLLPRERGHAQVSLHEHCLYSNADGVDRPHRASRVRIFVLRTKIIFT
jgi:hypothetical protein